MDAKPKRRYVCLTILAGAFGLLTPRSAWATPVQMAACNFSSATATCVLPNPVQGGDLLVFAFHAWNTPMVADALKNPWAQATTLNNQSIWYTVAKASGSDPVAMGTGGHGELFEYSGFSSLDVVASQANSAGTTAVSSGSATTTAPGDLVIGVMFGSGWSGTQAGHGFKMEAASNGEAIEDQVQSTAGPVAATFTEPTWSGASICLMAAFKDRRTSTTTSTSLEITAHWDDGTAVTAQVTLGQANLGAPDTILLTENLANGSVGLTGTLAPNATYDVTLACQGDTTGTCANGTLLYRFPFTTGMINPANLQSGQIDLIFRKADKSIKSAQVKVGMAF